MRRHRALVVVAATTCVAACGGQVGRAPNDVYPFELPPGFPRPRVQANEAVTQAKVELGRHLFYDRRLSANETLSCAGCHDQAHAFADPRTVPVGSTGSVLPRNGQSLSNVAYFAAFTWSNPVLGTLEKQALVPLLSDQPVELGWNDESVPRIMARLRDDETYTRLFKAAYPDVSEPLTRESIVGAITAFERTLVSGRSPYDRYIYDLDEGAITPEAKRGLDLFFSEKTECYHCHSGLTLGGSFVSEETPASTQYENTGLYNLDGRGAYPLGNNGLFEFTHRDEDRGRFRVPSLRNVGVTAPYMHDGSIPTLEAVLEHYTAGGREVKDGPNAGDGRKSPNKSNLVRPFALDESERAALLAFLRSLTDEAFLRDPSFMNPWPN
jgi:cytochrome c peroxidase